MFREGMHLKIVLLGPPGSGKGTQAKRLSKDFNLAHISTGDLLREAVNDRTELGKKAKGYMDSGRLVPDDLVIALVKETIERMDTGFVLDGFPRTVEQARKLEAISSIDVVINLQVEEELLVERLTMRRSCKECGAVYHLKFNPPKQEGVCDQCGGPLYQRSDDTESTVRERLRVYNQNTLPLVEYYQRKDNLVSIDGGMEIGEVYFAIVKALGPYM
jgi:adenylate kinase